MYNSPQTFFDDESPPTSPVQRNIPTFHLSPAPGHKADRSEHRRWNSLSRPKPHPLPFSYEYIFEEGKLAGLAEFHPEQDFLHYSSSRGSSATNSRNPSPRTSVEHSARSSTDTRYSAESERSQGPPSSPRTTDRIKRALSLSRTRGRRTSSDDKRRIPSPTPRPQGVGLGVSTTVAAPAESKTPTQIAVPVLPFESPRAAPTPKESKKPASISVPVPSPVSVPVPFESPRVAPRPPQKQSSNSTRSVPVAPQPELKRTDSKKHGLGITRPRKPSTSVAGKERSFEGPKRPAFVNPAMERAHTEPMMTGALQPEKVVARPAVRRKTSRFIEHLDDKPIQIEVETGKNDVPAMPFIPPFDFMLPTPPAQTELPRSPQPERKPRPVIRRSQTVGRRDPAYTHPEWPNLMATPLTKAESTPPARTVPRFALGPRTQPLPNHIVRKRSASNMKASESFKPASTTSLKRATSMRTRPSAMWADVCMAEVKPTLMSPVVASGHARMISC